MLVSVGLPSIAHHVLQTLASFVEFDPRGVLLRIGTLLEAGTKPPRMQGLRKVGAAGFEPATSRV